jgi:uncharacterized membrane protein YfcA
VHDVPRVVARSSRPLSRPFSPGYRPLWAYFRLILTVAAVQTVGAQSCRNASEIAGFRAAVLKVRIHLSPAESHMRTRVLLGSLVIGSLPGIFFGSHLSARVPDKVLRPVLATILVIVGVRMLRA